VVKPSVKRTVITYLVEKYNASIEQCVTLVNMSRSSWYYTSKLNDNEVILKLNELVEKYPNRGFENYYHRIRREGYKWAWSRLLRVYRQLGMVRRAKKRYILPDGEKKPLAQPKVQNEIWSMDFMSDALDDGRSFRVLNVIDDYNRECLISEGSISFPSARVIRELEQIKEERGLPKYIRTDNGPEFISKEYTQWCKGNGVTPVYAQPGKPMQNGYIERFNRTFREDILDAYVFTSIKQFNIISQKWRDEYNAYHPHGALRHQSPLDFSNKNSINEIKKEAASRVFNNSNNEKAEKAFSPLKY